MALLLPKSRCQNRSALPVALLIVSLMGAVASAGCGDHLRSISHDFWAHPATNIGEQTSLDWSELNSLPTRSGRLKAPANKTDNKQNVCWSCRGATPASHTTVLLGEVDQQIVLVGATDHSQTLQLGFGLPTNQPAVPIDLVCPLLRPPIV